MWTLLAVIFDRSESQKPARTNPLVSIPTNPKKTSAVLNGTKESDVTEVDSDDDVKATALYLSVWSSEEKISSTVDNIANPVLSISEESVLIQFFSTAVSQ